MSNSSFLKFLLGYFGRALQQVHKRASPRTWVLQEFDEVSRRFRHYITLAGHGW